MSVIHAERERHLGSRQLLFPVFVAVALVILLLRLWYLQVAQSENLRAQAQVYGKTTVKKPAPRGLVVDRNGLPIAGVRSTIVLTAVPRTVRENKFVVDKAAAMLNVPAEKLWEKVEAGMWKPYLPTPIHVNVPIDVATRIAENPDHLPGLDVESRPMRTYPDTTTLSHILGYVWTPSDRDVKRLAEKGLKPADFVGKSGIEFIYERELMGVPGSERVELDAKRRPLRTVGLDNPVPGNKLVLSLDFKLQRAAMELLAGRRGAVVAIDPSNGEVLCLASSPSFDTKLFQGGISKADWDRLENDPAKPQINRAINAAYAPGSTFKIVTTIAGMKTGKFDPNRPVFCSGAYQVGRRRFRCMSRHGSIAFERAMAKSCNVYFADLGMRAGEDALREASLAVGLGRRTGIDQLGEGKGVVPTMEWIAKWRNPPTWYPGDTVNFSVGQGEISTTPIQMAMVAALVANNGRSYVPHLLRAQVSPGNERKAAMLEKKVFAEIDAPPQFWQTMRRSLLAVVEEGTAAGSRIPGFQWGGKTGSAENRRNAETHSWFVAFAPYENPRIALAVVVENAGHGGSVAAPIASQLIRRYLMKRDAVVEVRSEPSPNAPRPVQGPMPAR